MLKQTVFAVMSSLFFFSCTFVMNSDRAPFPGTAKVEFNKDVALRSVAKVYAKFIEEDGDMNGTAFAIDKNRLVTAGHVCSMIEELVSKKEIENKIYIDYYSRDLEEINTKDGVTIVAIDPINDLCVLERPGHGLVPVSIVESDDDLIMHAAAFIVGCPLGLFASVFEGTIVSKSVTVGPKMRDKLVVTAAAYGGSSGSPVFNDRGQVIGVLIAGHTAFDHFSICTTVNKLRLFLKIVDFIKK